MADDSENHTIRLLQEMRTEMREFRSEVQMSFASVDERISDTNLRIDGVSHMMMLLAGNMGGHEERIDRLETTTAELAKDR